MSRVRRRPALLATAALALACNQGLEPESFVGICGTVRLRGAVPESTDVVFLVAFAQFPQSPADLFTFAPVPPPQLALGDTVAAYRLGLPPGRYEWVLAVWKKLGTLTGQNADTLLREAGFYRDPANPAQPGAVVVPSARCGVDFVVDFTDMHAVSDWFPGAPAR